MPRTKAGRAKTSTVSAAKRTRDSVTEEALATALRDLDAIVEAHKIDAALDHEQRCDQMSNLFKNIRMQLGPTLLALTLGDLAARDLGLGGCAADASTFSGNSTAYGGGKSVSRGDEGYLTEESGVYSSTITSSVSRSGRPLGPLASAKAKGRRSRSAQNANTTASSASGAITGRLTGRNTHTAAPTNANASTLQRSNSVRQSGHQSRSKFRTPGPAGGRLQTMSAERQMMMAPVTPKMQPDRPLSMLRYQKMGETVISLSGSPVIAQGVTREGANINIPVPNGIISVLPSAMTSVEPSFMSQLDPETLRQLRMLQSNLNMMMSQVKD